jgi:hypothetical protein
MSARGRALALTLALMSGTLAACGDRDDAMVNSRICADFGKPEAGKPGAPADAAAPVDTCVRRWAYSLAGARESADVVANATVGACAAALDHWNLTATDPAAADNGGAPPDATSLVSGQPTDAMAEHAAFAQRQALLYVIEARAGRCKPPPAKNGAPLMQ